MALKTLRPAEVTLRIWQEMNLPVNDWTDRVAGPVRTSTRESEIYGGPGRVGPMKVWKGRRTTDNLVSTTFEVANEKYENGFRVEGDDRVYDNFNLVDTAVQDLGVRYREHWMQLVTDLIVANGLCYDGQNFFDTDHSERNSGAQNNTVSQAAATGTDPTAGEMETGLLNCLEAFKRFKDDQGQPINEGKSSRILMVPPELSSAAQAALGAGIIVDAAATGGRTNILATIGGNWTLLENGRLSATDKAYVFLDDQRSFIRQQVGQAQITAKLGGSDFEHDTDAHEYGILVRRGVGYGNWQSAIRLTFT